MRVSIKLSPKAATEMQTGSTDSELRQRIAAIADRAGTALEPMHPDADDDELRTYYYAEVDDDRAGDLLERLHADADIEGAYVKPPDELP